MLRAFAWLVSNVVSLFGLTIDRNTRDWHTGEAHEDQLLTSNDIAQETRPAASIGLFTGSGHKPASPAKAGVQTPHAVRIRDKQALFPLIPTNVGIQGKYRALSCLAASSLHPQQNRFWIPNRILSLSKDVGTNGACRAKTA